jgi:hypothetical protein
MYRVATFLLKAWWGNFADMTDALSVLLLTWNQAYYRYGSFEAPQLEACLEKHWLTIESFRTREITTLADGDAHDIRVLFLDLLSALANAKGVSPVSVGKCLHLLAPSFFPIWDRRIAEEYGCRYDSDPASAYLNFCDQNKKIVESLRSLPTGSKKTLLKMIDEYNYVHYSKGWL